MARGRNREDMGNAVYAARQLFDADPEAFRRELLRLRELRRRLADSLSRTQK